MADRTSIEWTDATWTPIKGCTRKSPGCVNCYAEIMAARFSGPGQWGEGLATIVNTPQGKDHRWTGKTRLDVDELLKPLHWRKPRRIFVCSTSDLFHESVPDERIDRVFAVMALAPQHTFQVLTKRSARMREYFSAPILRQQMRGDFVREINRSGLNPKKGCTPDAIFDPYPLRNVWLGVSVEDQQRADERIPDLLATPAAVRWLSCEPLLGPVDLTRIMEAAAQECFHQRDKPPFTTRDGRVWTETRASLNCLTGHYWGEELVDGRWEGWCGEEDQPSPGLGSPGYYKPIDWVVTGGESGPGARPMHPDWARSLRDQCQAAGTAFFFKQWGEYLPYGHVDSDGCVNLRDRGEAPGLWHVWPNQKMDQDDHFSVRIGKKAAGRLLDGVEHNAMPPR